jgi:hypothetical protein
MPILAPAGRDGCGSLTAIRPAERSQMSGPSLPTARATVSDAVYNAIPARLERAAALMYDTHRLWLTRGRPHLTAPVQCPYTADFAMQAALASFRSTVTPEGMAIEAPESALIVFESVSFSLGAMLEDLLGAAMTPDQIDTIARIDLGPSLGFHHRAAG